MAPRKTSFTCSKTSVASASPVTCALGEKVNTSRIIKYATKDRAVLVAPGTCAQAAGDATAVAAFKYAMLPFGLRKLPRDNRFTRVLRRAEDPATGRQRVQFCEYRMRVCRAAGGAVTLLSLLLILCSESVIADLIVESVIEPPPEPSPQEVGTADRS